MNDIAKRYKWLLVFLSGYIIYGFVIAYYLYIASDYSIPKEYEGTAADPKLFMTEKEQLLSTEYSRLKHLLFFLALPYDWLIYLFVLIFGLSVYFQKLSEITAKIFFLQVGLYVFLLTFVGAVLSFPFSCITRKISMAYGISTP